MQTSLRGIAEKAKQDKHYRFGNLYGMLNKSALYCAWNGLNKKAAAGVDKETARTFSRELTGNLDTLVEELRSTQYKARLVKQVGIPKGNGKLRMLGLPTLRDKIVQKAVADILSAIYEQDFLKCSYGYRPNVGAQTAVQDVTKELMKRYSYVVEADIKGFFDNIDHDWLMKMLEQRIKDKPFLGLIRKWLKAGILKTTGDVTHPETGCPQGEWSVQSWQTSICTMLWTCGLKRSSRNRVVGTRTCAGWRMISSAHSGIRKTQTDSIRHCQAG